ncbi:MAG: DNA gyrase subunit B [Candidatus Marsarchaeota archaeon]|nr:DNA gyrase subunit B [Candidatus Marsarchaeota archaeon]
MSDEYSAKDITILSGTQGIRKRPAMYIGSTGSSGFIHLLYEVLDNAVDEALAGYCKNITIKLSTEDGGDVAEVSDDGRGIPVDMIPKVNKPALEVLMTSLHSGAKFDNSSYKVAGGLHGVGLTVVNALSEYTVVTVRKNGKEYKQEFSRGIPTTQLEVIGESEGNGTTIRFKPDAQIFSSKSFDTLILTERLRYLSYLNPGIRIELVDSREEEEKRAEFFSKDGISGFLEYIRGERNPISKPLLMKGLQDSVSVAITMQYVQSYSEEIVSFVNNIKTPYGGTHVTGFHSALTRTIYSYMQKNPKTQTKANVEGDDTREGLLCIISVLMPNPEFEGQTKEKLGNTQIKSLVENLVYKELSTYLEENPAEAVKIVGKITNAADAREAARRAKELARNKSAFEGSILPGKLSDCTDRDPERSEIFIVEGESAAGSSKQARDRMYQAILPLKGKILNVEKATDEKIFSNAELHTMVVAFGTGIRETFNPNKLRYGKVIFLTDADVDGSHIKTLLLTFFYRYLKPLIEKGNVYIANPPLYKITKGREVKYAYSESEKEGILKGMEGKIGLQRYKGLGEMNPEQLWETTMNPENRVLRRITIKDAVLANSMFTILMGKDVSERRRFLEEHSTEVTFLDI